MDFNQVFSGEIAQGEKEFQRRIKITSENYYRTKINKLPVGEKVFITVSNRKPKRSDSQNRLYWLYLHYIEDETGNEADALHEHFRRKFGVKEIKPVIIKDKEGKETISEEILYKSTTNYSKPEFSMYMKRIEVETSIPIPDTEGYLLDCIYGEDKSIINSSIEYPEREEDGEVPF